MRNDPCIIGNTPFALPLIGHLCRIGYIMSEPGLVPEFHFLDFAHLVGHGVEIQGDPVDTGFRNGVCYRVFSDGEGHVACVELVVAAFVVGNAEITRRQLREAFENARFTADIQIVTSLRNQNRQGFVQGDGFLVLGGGTLHVDCEGYSERTLQQEEVVIRIVHMNPERNFLSVAFPFLFIHFPSVIPLVAECMAENVVEQRILFSLGLLRVTAVVFEMSPELGRAVGIGTDELVAGVRVAALFDVPCVVHNAPYAVAFVREFGLVARTGNEELDFRDFLELIGHIGEVHVEPVNAVVLDSYGSRRFVVLDEFHPVLLGQPEVAVEVVGDNQFACSQLRKDFVSPGLALIRVLAFRRVDDAGSEQGELLLSLGDSSGNLDLRRHRVYGIDAGEGYRAYSGFAAVNL